MQISAEWRAPAFGTGNYKKQESRNNDLTEHMHHLSPSLLYVSRQGRHWEGRSQDEKHKGQGPQLLWELQEGTQQRTVVNFGLLKSEQH